MVSLVSLRLDIPHVDTGNVEHRQSHNHHPPLLISANPIASSRADALRGIPPHIMLYGILHAGEAFFSTALYTKEK